MCEFSSKLYALGMMFMGMMVAGKKSTLHSMLAIKRETLRNRYTWLVSSLVIHLNELTLLDRAVIGRSLGNSRTNKIMVIDGYIEYQGGAFDPWSGPGYGACYQLINEQVCGHFLSHG
jgi:hypothetical protein